MPYCSDCGSEVQESTNYCPDCGANLNPSEQESESRSFINPGPMPETAFGKLVFGLKWLVILVVAFLIVIFLISFVIGFIEGFTSAASGYLVPSWRGELLASPQ